MIVTEPPEHAEYLRRDEIGAFLDYYDGLVTDSEDEDVDEESRAYAREELDGFDSKAVQQLRDMYEETSHTEDDFVSEMYWDDYAADYANDVLLYGVDSTVASYFDYDMWARDMRFDYTAYVYDGVTYYTRS